MVNLSVPFPEELRDKAEAAARESGLSIDEFVRRCVTSALADNRTSDPLFADKRVFSGESPADLSVNHDYYLHEAER
jgi:hypothetical protein